MEAQPLTDWNTDLFECFEDASTCCYGFWCHCCLASTVAAQFGENRCLPLCDKCSPAVTAACGIPLSAPVAATSIRASMRTRYGIKGSICEDIIISCFCEWCSWCQMHREIKRRKKDPAVINIVNMHPAPVVMQPPVMMSSAPVMMPPAPVMMPSAPVMMQPAPLMMVPADPASAVHVNSSLAIMG